MSDEKREREWAQWRAADVNAQRVAAGLAPLTTRHDWEQYGLSPDALAGAPPASPPAFREAHGAAFAWAEQVVREEMCRVVDRRTEPFVLAGGAATEPLTYSVHVDFGSLDAARLEDAIVRAQDRAVLRRVARDPSVRWATDEEIAAGHAALVAGITVRPVGAVTWSAPDAAERHADAEAHARRLAACWAGARDVAADTRARLADDEAREARDRQELLAALRPLDGAARARVCAGVGFDDGKGL